MKDRLALRCLVTALSFSLSLGASGCYGNAADDRKVPLSASSSPAGERGATAPGTAATGKPQPPMSAQAQSALETGNAAFRAKDYAAALVAFEKARALAPEHAAPWFGIYMVAQARKDNRAADAALKEIQLRSEVMPNGPAVLDSAAMRRAHEQAGVRVVKP
jgi:hypothetical protein